MNFPDKHYINTHLKGCLELSLFLKRGADKFQDTMNGFWLSLLVPVLLIPLNVVLAYVYPDFRESSSLTLFVIFAYQIGISTAFCLGSVWLVCWPLDRNAEFPRFGTAYNWLSVVGCVLFIPYLFVLLVTPFDAEQLSHLLLTTIGLFYCILGFTVRHTLNVSWVIAVLITALAAGCEVLAALMLF
jgi:hypothetical protein